jgi:type IV secretion system protein VirB5
MDLRALFYRLRHGHRPPEEDAVVLAPGTLRTGDTSGDGATQDVAVPSVVAGEEEPIPPPPGMPRDTKVRSVPNYLLGRREFADQFTNLAKGKRNWQLVAFAALGLLGVVTVAYIGLATSVRVQPFVVEVDELGQVRGFHEVENVYSAREAVTDATLRHFVRNLRTVYADPAAQRDLIVSAYAFADASVQEWLNGYFSDPEHDPRLVMRRLARRVEVKSVLRVPAEEAGLGEMESWKVTWVEVETPTGTDTQRRAAWEGYFTVEQVPEAVRPENPLGLYVTAVNWSRVSAGTPR